MVRFIHASDLHLGAAFEGIRATSPEVAEVLARSTYDALDAIVKLARDESAAFVLLAGDTCNRAEGNLRAHLALRKAARELQESGIALFIVFGNHDYLAPGRPDLDWPENCTVFGSDASEPVIVSTDAGEAAVFGLSYGRRDEKQNLALRYPAPPGDLFSIGLLHTACGPVSGHASYAPCTVEDLVARGYDYWALGHVHARAVLRPSSPAIAYPGNPQGLNPNETGPRGCLLVSVDDRKNPTIEFRETDAVRWCIEDVDITGMQRDQDLQDALEARLTELQGHGRPSLVRFRLVGRGPLHRLTSATSDLSDFEEHLRASGSGAHPIVWTESIRVLTQPDMDMEARRQSEDLLGDFLRIADDLRSSDERIAELAAKLAGEAKKPLQEIGLDAAWIGPERVREWLAQAEWMGADRLIRAED